MNLYLLDIREFTEANIPQQHLHVCTETCSMGSLVSHKVANPTKALFMAWMFITFMCVPWCLVQAEVSLHPFIKNLRNTLLTRWLL